MRQIILFVKSSLEEINPWHNIRTLKTNIWHDILAGITVGIIALPLALAFGEMSSLGPLSGIWSSIVGGIIGGIFGGCLVGVSGPTAPMATQVAAFMGAFVIGSSNQPDLVAAFSIIFLSGLILVCISLLQISKFIHYIPYSVVSGFMCGIGVIIILSQINAFIGLESEKSIDLVLKNFRNSIQNINIEALYVSLPSLLIVLFWSKIKKKFKSLSSVPSPLIALIIGTGIAYIFNLDIFYIGDKMGDTNQSDFFSFYLPDFQRIGEFLLPALMLSGLIIIDSLLSCKIADNMIGKYHSSDRETFGQGMANMVSGLFGGISTATATVQTVGNITFGAKTPLATITKGLTLLAILLGLGPVVASIPNACLAAILFKLGIEILDHRVIPVIRKMPQVDLLIFIVVLFITVYKDLMIAVIVGLGIACFLSVKKLLESNKIENKHQVLSFAQSPFISENLKIDEIVNYPIKVLQPKGPLFFGSIISLNKIYLNIPSHECLILDMSYIKMIDLSGIFALEDLVKNIQSQGKDVIVTNAISNIKSVLLKIDFFDHIGIENYFESTESVASFVLEKYKHKINFI